jgi:predicted nucleotidyltransferase
VKNPSGACLLRRVSGIYWNLNARYNFIFRQLDNSHFGSYAYGKPKPESDVDLLVIMDTQLSEIEQAATICRRIPYRFGLDLIVYTPRRLAQRLEWGDSFLKEITQRGVVLYESPDT